MDILERLCKQWANLDPLDPYRADINDAVSEIMRLREVEAGWLEANAPGGWIGELRDLAKMQVAYRQENERLRMILQNLVQQLDSKNRGNVDAPGHSHNIPGVWDNDNGELAGKPCAWCALWREAKAMVQPHNAELTARDSGAGPA